ncbi:hypothetical protein J3F83DRAFT_16271 [Trichoderma novae-zelandiae]
MAPRACRDQNETEASRHWTAGFLPRHSPDQSKNPPPSSKASSEILPMQTPRAHQFRHDRFDAGSATCRLSWSWRRKLSAAAGQGQLRMVRHQRRLLSCKCSSCSAALGNDDGRDGPTVIRYHIKGGTGGPRFPAAGQVTCRLGTIPRESARWPLPIATRCNTVPGG